MVTRCCKFSLSQPDLRKALTSMHLTSAGSTASSDYAAMLTRLHQLRGLGDAKVLKSLGHSPKGRHYRG